MPGSPSVQNWESTNVYTDASNQIYVLARKQPKKCLPNRGSNVLVLTQKERLSLMNKTLLFKMFRSRWALSSCFAFYGEFLSLPLDQSRRYVLWPLMHQIYLMFGLLTAGLLHPPRVCAQSRTGCKAVKHRSSGGSSTFLYTDKRACKSIILQGL